MAEEEKKDQTPPAEGAAGAAPEAGSPEEAEALAKAKKRKMLMIGGGAVAVVGVLIAVAVLIFGGKKEPEPDPAAPAALVIYDVPQMNVNLLGENSSQTFLRAKFALELSKPEDLPTAEKLLPRLQDDWQGFLRQMRVDDFRGTAAVDRLKNALLLRTRQVMAPMTVNNVLVREILVQ